MKKKLIWYGAAGVLLLAAAILFFRIGSYWKEDSQADGLVSSMASQGTPRPPEATSPDLPTPPTVGSPEATEPLPRSVDIAALQEEYPELIAWIYCEDVVDLPVMQGANNTYYLDHLPDGSYNRNGSLFLDAATASDFTAPNNVIYGHNMTSGAMFHHLLDYRQQDFFESHPVMYLYTATTVYRVELFAGQAVPDSAAIFSQNPGTDAWADALAASDFNVGLTDVPSGPILTLVTCAYEFEYARYVVHGVLIKI